TCGCCWTAGDDDGRPGTCRQKAASRQLVRARGQPTTAMLALDGLLLNLLCTVRAASLLRHRVQGCEFVPATRAANHLLPPCPLTISSARSGTALRQDVARAASNSAAPAR